MLGITVPLTVYSRSRDGAVVRALASHQCGLGSIPGPADIRGLSSLLVLSLAPGVFLRVLRFSSLHKTITPNSNSIWNQWTNSHSVDVPLQIPIYLFILLFI